VREKKRKKRLYGMYVIRESIVHSVVTEDVQRPYNVSWMKTREMESKISNPRKRHTTQTHTQPPIT
jgi:hypothetical protein